MTLPIHALRTKFTAVTLGVMMVASGHAVAKNHDCQSVRLAPTVLASHDRAPGPASRLPN